MTPREVVPCHHSLVPNWKVSQPCSKEHWIENHLRKKKLHTLFSSLLGSLGLCRCCGRIRPVMDTRCMDLPAEGSWICLPPLLSAGGSGRDDPAAAAHREPGKCTCPCHLRSPQHHSKAGPHLCPRMVFVPIFLSSHCPPHITLGTGGSWSLLQRKQESNSHR